MSRLLIFAAAPAFFGSGILDSYGVLAVFLFVVVENFGAPIPGETMLVAASAYAASGHLNIVWVVLSCIVGVWTGSTLSYLAGRRGGMALLRRTRIPEQHLVRAQTYMTRWGGYTVFLGRYIAFLRSYIGWLAGLNGMAAGPFMLWNLAGATAWTLTFSVLGFELGHNWSLIERIFKTIGYGGAAVVVLAAIGFFVYRRRRAARTEELDAAPTADEQRETVGSRE